MSLNYDIFVNFVCILTCLFRPTHRSFIWSKIIIASVLPIYKYCFLQVQQKEIFFQTENALFSEHHISPALLYPIMSKEKIYQSRYRHLSHPNHATNSFFLKWCIVQQQRSGICWNKWDLICIIWRVIRMVWCRLEKKRENCWTRKHSLHTGIHNFVEDRNRMVNKLLADPISPLQQKVTERRICRCVCPGIASQII